MKKQNLKEETKKRKELVTSMEEVRREDKERVCRWWCEREGRQADSLKYDLTKTTVSLSLSPLSVLCFPTQDKKMLVVKEAEVSKVAEKLSALQEEGQKDSAALEAAQCHFKAVSAGLSTNEDGEEATLAGQMMTCKNDMSKADTEAKQAQMKLKHAQKELKAKQTEVKKMDSGYQKDQEAFNTVKKNKEKLEADMGKLQYQGR
uniref:Uncharacterized protein n=1 Tax=Hucho hucho TaxID=62062 RepID=A0A4W5LRD3_9TELE